MVAKLKRPYRYTVYRGDEYIGEGTIKELVKLTGLSYSTLRDYAIPAYAAQMKTHKLSPNCPRYELYRVGGGQRLNKPHVYAAYRDDKYLGSGTLQELVTITGLAIDTLRWYSKPSIRKRNNPREYDKGHPRLILVDLDEEDEDDE